MENIPEISAAVSLIAEKFAPKRVYLYNRRMGLRGNTTAFKLCLILDTADKDAAEREIYLTIDSEIPYDVLIYTPEEWEIFSSDASSFANKVRETGVIVYE